MKICITGASGFIGSHVVDIVKSDGVHELEIIKVMDTIPNGCDALIHMSAVGVNNVDEDWYDLLRINVEQSFLLWMRAADAGIKRFVICGSCYEYGRYGDRLKKIPSNAPLEPVTKYAASKAMATMQATAFASDRNVSVVIVRPFQVYGPRERFPRLVPSLRHAARCGHDFPMTEGQQIRDFIPVDKVAREILNSVPNENSSFLIKNIGTGQGRTVLSFAQELWSEWKADGKLLPGSFPYRKNEVMSYVAQL